MELIDVHGHLMDAQYDEDVEEVISRAVEGGVKAMICAGTDLMTSRQAVEMSENHDNVFAVIGIHPENVTNEQNSSLEDTLCELKTLAKNKKVLGIGEIGLDYHYMQGLSLEEVQKIKDLQMRIFVAQIELANSLNLPIVVHSRDAMGDTLEILKNHPLKKKFLLHCYSGSLESANELMKLGAYFSFGGVTTFKNAKNVQEVVKNLPLERIMLETDCPYLSPEPFRGKRNEPKNVVYVADAIAKLKGIKIDEVASATTQNASLFFWRKEK